MKILFDSANGEHLVSLDNVEVIDLISNRIYITFKSMEKPQIFTFADNVFASAVFCRISEKMRGMC
jgi:hypothetical protein